MKDLREQVKNGGDRKAAAVVGQKLAEVAKAKGITRVVLDRRWYRFHGRVRSFAEACAKGGLDFIRVADPEKAKHKQERAKVKAAAPPKKEESKEGKKKQKTVAGKQ